MLKLKDKNNKKKTRAQDEAGAGPAAGQFFPGLVRRTVWVYNEQVYGRKNGEEKQDSEEARLSVTDALAIGDYIEKNNSLKESKSMKKVAKMVKT